MNFFGIIKVLNHQSHLRALIYEVFKSLNNLNPKFMWSYFVFKNITYNIRKGPLLRLPAAKSTSYGVNSVLFWACLLWNSLPQSVKYSESIVERPRKYWLFMYFISMNSIKNKSFIHPVGAWTYFDISVVYSCLCMAATLILL